MICKDSHGFAVNLKNKAAYYNDIFCYFLFSQGSSGLHTVSFRRISSPQTASQREPQNQQEHHWKLFGSTYVCRVSSF